MDSAGVTGRSRLLPRAAWWLLLLAVGVIAIFVELDRQARQDAAYARLVPGWLASFALEQGASAALGEERYDAALGYARRLVSLRPIPAENLTALALAADGKGDDDLAAAAIGEAATRGWREPVAQVAVLDAAIQQGEWTVATQRLDALRRTGQPAELSTEALQVIGSDPEGRAELARRLADGAPWSDDFLAHGPALLEPAAFAQVLVNSEKLGAHFDCARLSASAVELLRKGQAQAARSIWQGECARFGGQDADDTGFNPVESGGLSPFAWSYPEEAGLFRLAEGEGAAARLTWSNASVLERKLAQRYFDLAPGSHMIAIEAAEPARGGVANGRLRLEVMCFAPSSDKPVTHRVPVMPDGSVTISPDCPVQRIGLLAGGGKGAARKVTVSRVGGAP